MSVSGVFVDQVAKLTPDVGLLIEPVPRNGRQNGLESSQRGPRRCGCPPGTPAEESWPGVSSSEEFRSYLFPQYRPQNLINHVPR